MTLGDAAVVRREYQTEERCLRRSLRHWAIYEGPDPREHALLALLAGRPRRLLDAGCGTGEFAARAAAVLDTDVVGVDQSERMVELTRERGLEAHVADVRRLPFPAAAFDAVTALWMLYHLPDLDRGLGEIARVLAPAGRFVSVHNCERHLVELWGPDTETAFAAENGAETLRRRFDRVEAHEVRGAATFATRENLLGYLRAFETLHGRDETWRADAVRLPLRVTCSNVVLVASGAPA